MEGDYQMKKIVENLKTDFREWYGLLSIEEIMRNQKLIHAIENTERVIKSLEVNFK